MSKSWWLALGLAAMVACGQFGEEPNDSGVSGDPMGQIGEEPDDTASAPSEEEDCADEYDDDGDGDVDCADPDCQDSLDCS